MTIGFRTTLFRNTVSHTLLGLSSVVAGVFVSVVTARLLGPVEFGDYSTIIWITGAVGVVGTLGLGPTLAKYIAELGSEPGRARASRLTLTSWTVSLAATGALVGLAVSFVQISMTEPARTYGTLFLFALVPASVQTISTGVLAGLRRYDYLALVAVASATGSITFIYLLLSLGYGLTGLAAYAFAASTVFAVVAYVIVRRNLATGDQSSVVDPDLQRRFIRYAVSSMAILALNAVVWERSDVLFLQLFRYDAEAGLFSAAFGITKRTVFFIPGLFMGVLLPSMSYLFGRRELSKLARLLTASTRILIAIGVLLVALVVPLAQPLVLILYGEAYMGAVLPVQILAISSFSAVVAGASSSAILALDKPHHVVALLSGMAGASVLCDVVLIPPLGLMGAAIANLVVQGAAAALTMYLAFRYLGPETASLRRSTSAALAAGFAAGSTAFMIELVIGTGSFATVLVGLFAASVPAVLVYFATMVWLRGVRYLELERLIGLVGKSGYPGRSLAVAVLSPLLHLAHRRSD